MNKAEAQIVALAGLFQATFAVHSIAKDGACDQQDLETAIHSLLMTAPENTTDVYGTLANLKNGLSALEQILGNKNSGKDIQPVRYAMALLHLENKLSKNPEMLNLIADRLKHSSTQIEHFGPCHENVIEGLAGIYTDTISTFQLRVQVAGKPEHLQTPLNAAKIRTLLLAGIRSAMLWRQMGGHRWHFIFKRRKMLQICKTLREHG